IVARSLGRLALSAFERVLLFREKLLSERGFFIGNCLHFFPLIQVRPSSRLLAREMPFRFLLRHSCERALLLFRSSCRTVERRRFGGIPSRWNRDRLVAGKEDVLVTQRRVRFRRLPRSTGFFRTAFRGVHVAGRLIGARGFEPRRSLPWS